MSGFFARRVRQPELRRQDAFEEVLSGPEIHALFDYWNARRGDRPMPARADIDPLDMPRSLLPHLYIVTVEADGGYRFRLVGTRLLEVFRFDITGMRLEEVLVDTDLSNAVRSYDRIVKRAVPWYSRVVYQVEGVSGVLYQRLTLPLGTEGKVEHLLGGLTVHRDQRIYEEFYESHGRQALDVEERLEAVLDL